VTVNPDSSSVKVGTTEVLTVMVLDAQGHQLTRRVIFPATSTPSIISVNGGNVTGVAAGNGLVSYSSEGVTKVAKVTVTP
jgi:uncharacterized protein YjdB